MRAEEKQRTRSTLKELQDLMDQLRTIAPTVRTEMQDEARAKGKRRKQAGK